MQLIHQIVLGDTVPKLNRECLDSWHKLEAFGFRVVLWTNPTVREYLRSSARPDAAALYRKARNFGEASDILRIALTHTYGGFYVDWDVLLVNPDRFLTVVAGYESSQCLLIRDRLTKEPQFSCSYDNSLFYLPKGHTFALEFLSEIERNYASSPLPQTPYLTGPLALARFLQRHPGHGRDCRMIDTLEMYAFDYEDVLGHAPDPGDRALLSRAGMNGAPAIHFWTHAWAPKPTWSRRVIDKAVRTVRLLASSESAD